MSDKSWWDASLTFEATQEEAGEIFEALTEVACGGESEGDDHECLRDVVGSLKPADDFDSECVRQQEGLVEKMKQILRRG